MSFIDRVQDWLDDLGYQLFGWFDPTLTVTEILPGPIWSPIQAVPLVFHFGPYSGRNAQGDLNSDQEPGGDYQAQWVSYDYDGDGPLPAFTFSPINPVINIYPSAYQSVGTLVEAIIHENSHYFWSLQPQGLKDLSEAAVGAAKNIFFPGVSLWNSYNTRVKGNYQADAPIGDETWAYFVSDLLTPDWLYSISLPQALAGAALLSGWPLPGLSFWPSQSDLAQGALALVDAVSSATGTLLQDGQFSSGAELRNLADLTVAP